MTFLIESTQDPGTQAAAESIALSFDTVGGSCEIPMTFLIESCERNARGGRGG